MKQFTSFIRPMFKSAPALFFTIVFGLCLIGLEPSSGGSPVFAQQKQDDSAPPPAPVVVGKAEKRLVSEQLTLIGTAQAYRTSTIASEISGLVIHFPVREGDFVKKGEVLARLNDEKLILQHKAAEASIERIRTNLALAEKELDRYTRLSETNSVAGRKYDEALAAYRVLSREIDKTKAEIESLEYDIRRKEVVAPFSGFVAKEHTQVGEWMVPGGPVVTLADLDRMWIIVDVPERYLPLLPQKGEVTVTVGSAGKDRISGRIDAVLPIGDERARTFPVKIGIENTDFHVKSGMEAIVKTGLANRMEALLVPKDAVVPTGNDRVVYRVVDGKANPVTVEVGGYYEGSAIVAGDLAVGDQVVIRGNERLRPGQDVRIIQ